MIAPLLIFELVEVGVLQLVRMASSRGFYGREMSAIILSARRAAHEFQHGTLPPHVIVENKAASLAAYLDVI